MQLVPVLHAAAVVRAAPAHCHWAAARPRTVAVSGPDPPGYAARCCVMLWHQRCCCRRIAGKVQQLEQHWLFVRSNLISAAALPEAASKCSSHQGECSSA